MEPSLLTLCQRATWLADKFGTIRASQAQIVAVEAGELDDEIEQALDPLVRAQLYSSLPKATPRSSRKGRKGKSSADSVDDDEGEGKDNVAVEQLLMGKSSVVPVEPASPKTARAAGEQGDSVASTPAGSPSGKRVSMRSARKGTRSQALGDEESDVLSELDTETEHEEHVKPEVVGEDGETDDLDTPRGQDAETPDVEEGDERPAKKMTKKQSLAATKRKCRREPPSFLWQLTIFSSLSGAATLKRKAESELSEASPPPMSDTKPSKRQRTDELAGSTKVGSAGEFIFF